jgi:nucleotide sugar dehydrogenase
MKNIAIIGHGYVGKAVDYGFTTNEVKKILIDPALYDNSVSDLRGTRIDASFVCVPTPMGKDGSIDASIVIQTVKELASITQGMIIIKSTVVPSVVEDLSNVHRHVIYNPEFLTEKNALDDFINPPMHVFGGDSKATKELEKLYENHSRCKPCPVFHMTAMEASFVKYGINSFLATKVLWMNQFQDICDNYHAKYNVIANAIGSDPRIGHSHMQVPGPDGRKGFGGACFPKDTKAFAHFADKEFSLLNEVIEQNNQYRSQYELDDREKEQNVVYI